MSSTRGDEPRLATAEPALRAIMRRLRQIMADPGDGQHRLDKIVRQVAGLMVAEVCSIYIKRQDASLELFATEGLKRDAVHATRLKRGEGLVGRCAELAVPVNVPNAQAHPAFSYRPETGEEAYHSLLAVPVLRGGAVLGVLVVQNRTPREYSDEDVEVLQTTAMLVAEHLVSGDVVGMLQDTTVSRTTTYLRGEPISDGIALGHVVIHQPRVVVTELLAEDPEAEVERLDRAVVGLRTAIDAMLSSETISKAGAHHDVLEAYRMFANDRGWLRRMQSAAREGLTAEAAVERVQNTTRMRLLHQNDPFWRERLRDLDDLSDRLLRILSGKGNIAFHDLELPEDTILVARNMGPAELLDYDRTRLRALVVEDASAQSHVAIVAKALGLPAIGQIPNVIERLSSGDPIIVDAEAGELHIRPSPDVIAAYSDKVRLRARRQMQFRALRDVPAVSKDGVRVELHLNAGLMVDMPNLIESGADGIGLFRTELQFMIASTFPRVDQQTRTYREILDSVNDKPVTFRVLDIGGDKALPYMRQPKEDNPALGWRAVRLALDRPGLFRMQVRALLRAAAGRELRVMIPMITTVSEFRRAKSLIDHERSLASKRGQAQPERVLVGAMIEVPGLIYTLDELLPEVDFASVGSNDLLQYLLAADRTNPLVASRYDSLSLASLRALREIVRATQRHNVQLTLCGEIGGGTLEAMALLAIGFRKISMAPASIGPVKNMVLSLDIGRARDLVEKALDWGEADNVRDQLRRFAETDSVEI
ncbi:MAG: phosphoenolpyruvate--protein phosphotransferase [Hyphomicrobiaceae bacterium]